MNFFKKFWSKFQILKIWQKALVLILVLYVVGALTGTLDTSSTTSTTAKSNSESSESVEKSTLNKLNDYSVNWDNYASTAKQRIADLIDESDCTNLQVEFDSADSNNDTQRNRTGESNANLMALLDDQMKKLGCY